MAVGSAFVLLALIVLVVVVPQRSDDEDPDAGAVDATVPEPVGEARWPGPETTGVRPGTELRPSPAITIADDGAVVEGLEVTGQLTINADDVTVRNTFVRASGSRFGIRILEGASGVVLREVTVVGDPGCAAGVTGAGYRAVALDVSACNDGFKVGADTTIEETWVHDLRKEPGSHNDCIQSTGGDGIQILRNRLDGPFQTSTSALKLDGQRSPLRDVVIDGNLLHGGSFTLYLGIGNGAVHEDPSRIRVRGNTWVEDSWDVGPMSIERQVEISEWRDNELASGETLELHYSNRR